jgi:hypothetical protein
MSNISLRRAVTQIYQGVKVEATTNPIANGQNAVFNIVGGRILLLDLMGLVTVELQAAALLLHWDADMDIGGDAALSIDSADLTGDVVGTMYCMPAAAGGAMTVPAGGAYLRLFPALGWVIGAGALDLHASAARTGGIKWTAFYVPIDDAAYVVAA